MRIRHAVFDKLVQTAFPENSTKPCKIKEFSVENFKRNYVFEKSKSLASGCAAYLFCALTFKNTCCGHATYAMAEAVASIAFIYIWNKWGNQNYEWVVQASQAMRNQNEKETLTHIEKGANISHCLNSYPTLFPFIFYKVPTDKYQYLDLFDQAVKTNCLNVLLCLFSLGHNVNKNVYLGSVHKLETAQLLCSMGADVNLRIGKQFSPLSLQFLNLKKAKVDSYDERFRVIDFLIEKGAIIEDNSLEKSNTIICITKIISQSISSQEIKQKIREIFIKLSKNWQTRPSF